MSAQNSNPWENASAAPQAADSAQTASDPGLVRVIPRRQPIMGLTPGVRGSRAHDAASSDWLSGAPAPQPEHFSILEPFHKTWIPLDSWVTEGIDWVVNHFRPVFQGIRVPSIIS